MIDMHPFQVDARRGSDQRGLLLRVIDLFKQGKQLCIMSKPTIKIVCVRTEYIGQPL